MRWTCRSPPLCRREDQRRSQVRILVLFLPLRFWERMLYLYFCKLWILNWDAGSVLGRDVLDELWLKYMKNIKPPSILLPVPITTHDFAGDEKWHVMSWEELSTFRENIVPVWGRQKVEVGIIWDSARRGRSAIDVRFVFHFYIKGVWWYLVLRALFSSPFCALLWRCWRLVWWLVINVWIPKRQNFPIYMIRIRLLHIVWTSLQVVQTSTILEISCKRVNYLG